MHSNECSLCNTETTEEEGKIDFFIGILPYTLCPVCFNGLEEMFDYFREEDE